MALREVTWLDALSDLACKPATEECWYWTEGRFGVAVRPQPKNQSTVRFTVVLCTKLPEVAVMVSV